MNHDEIAACLRALRAHVDAETHALTSSLDWDLLDEGTRMDLERHADAIATCGAAIREVIDPRHRGAVRKKVRKALGYAYP